jgi:putative acyl-CoA dehydrogenase
MTLPQSNPNPQAFAITHEVFNQTPPLLDFNAFDCDTALKEGVVRAGAVWAIPQLTEYGARIGSAEVTRWGFEVNEFKPQFFSHDRNGHRIDLVKYHDSYHQLMSMALTAGIHSAPWVTPEPGAHVTRAAKVYLQAQADAGHGCPLTMTFAAVPTLDTTPALAREWLPKILANGYDPRNVPYTEKMALTIGMGMTEKQGGSDVRANTTTAHALGTGGTGEAYELVGHKWFTSAPMCDAFLMLGQSRGGLSCFLVPRWRPDGSKNPVEVQRLKNKMGNVSNASSEIELRGALGWMVGDEGRGVWTIIEMVAMTRFDCMLGSSASQRQGVAQAIHHAEHRSAFGKTLIHQPLMRNVLADLQLEVEGSLAIALRMARALDHTQDVHEQLLLRIGVPVGKYWICKRSPFHAYEAMECLGGNGVIEDFITARLYRDAPINAIWEGSGNVQALDVLRALSRTPEALEAWLLELDKGHGNHATLDASVARLKAQLADMTDAEYRARHLVDQLALTMQASLLVQAGNNAVAGAFIASRLGTQSDRNYGTLPRGLDIDTIIARGNPTLS